MKWLDFAHENLPSNRKYDRIWTSHMSSDENQSGIVSWFFESNESHVAHKLQTVGQQKSVVFMLSLLIFIISNASFRLVFLTLPVPLSSAGQRGVNLQAHEEEAGLSGSHGDRGSPWTPRPASVPVCPCFHRRPTPPHLLCFSPLNWVIAIRLHSWDNIGGNCPWALFNLLLRDSRDALRAHQHLNPVEQRDMVCSSEQGHSEPRDLFLGSVIRCNWVTHLCLCRGSRLNREWQWLE